jgi:glycosyltransferase involved in cell wall biosynthesis
MRFSVIIPSRLADYPSSAKDKDPKLLRAVNSVLVQTFDDFEVHIIADGCDRTIEIIQEYVNDSRVHLWKIDHSKLWSGVPRNTGIDQAQGENIIYLDIDDAWGPNHLEVINRNLNGFDWVWFNDIRYNPRLNYWFENYCDINQLGRHGTSNLCHKRELGARWDENGKYAHDYYFTQKLKQFSNYVKIETPEYYVFHIPGTKVSGGYDL